MKTLPTRIGVALLGGMLTAAVAGACYAQDGGTECSRNAETTAEMQSCADEALGQVDSQMNGAYQALIERLEPAGVERLRRAQRAWVAFRDSECAFRGLATEGGTMNPVVITECLAGLTASRLDQFEIYLTCEEGDLACPPLAPLE